MKQYLNTMLCSPSDVKAVTATNYNVEDGEVGVAIRRAQDIYLQPIIGTKMLRKLQTLIYNAVQGAPDNIDDASNERYATLLDEYVRPLLIAQAFDTLLLQISFKVRNIGVSRNTDNGVQYAPIEDVRYLQETIRTDIAAYSTRVSHYLGGHKDDFADELTRDGDGCPPMLNKDFANTRIWLGSARQKCGC